MYYFQANVVNLNVTKTKIVRFTNIAIQKNSIVLTAAIKIETVMAVKYVATFDVSNLHVNITKIVKRNINIA